MATDNKKAKADPAPKSEAAAKDKSNADGPHLYRLKSSISIVAAIFAAAHWSRGERPLMWRWEHPALQL
jgi:hypothetical protein